MAFFNKMGEALSNKSKDVVKKAKEMAEIVSLNGQINSQEEIINKTYIEIGKSYYELHKEEADNIYAPQFEIISNAFSKIEELKVDISNIKGVQKCPNCSCEISEGVTYCPSCGAKLEFPEATTGVAEVIEGEVIEAEVIEN